MATNQKQDKSPEMVSWGQLVITQTFCEGLVSKHAE